jgi:hypothetical protein
VFAVRNIDVQDIGAMTSRPKTSTSKRWFSGIDSNPNGKIASTPINSANGNMAQKMVALINPPITNAQ